MMPAAAMKLWEGSIEVISEPSFDQNKDPGYKPVLQVLDVRLLNTKSNSSNTERYRLVLSDGVQSQQGMLAVQLNELVRSQRLQRGSIVQLTQCTSSLVQNRVIIIVIELDVILEKCDPIGQPKPCALKVDNNASATTRSPSSVKMANQTGNVTGNPVSVGAGSIICGSVPRPNVVGANCLQHTVMDCSAGRYTYGNNSDSGQLNSTTVSSAYSNADPGSGILRAPVNSYLRPPQPSYQHPSPLYSNRGPITRNEAPARIVPIAALNPYQGRWTIKARVTAKGELRQYNNPRGDGKVFSFDLLDESSEIRVTCFNAVAEQFYNQVEPGKLYMISKGSLVPAQKTFNHLRNDHEIRLDSYSTIQPCDEDDGLIPHQNWNFRPIVDIEGMENNSVLDVIGVVSSISPCSTIMRKNGTETQKRTLQLKDMSGRSVEITLWGIFCNAEGTTLQNMCDSGIYPVLAVKSGRVNDFNGKSVGTLSTSQLFIEPDFPKAHKLRNWFDQNGKNTPVVSISRDTASMVRTDVRKTVSHIKDEKLGTSDKPDWITICGTLTFIKADNFCYTACPIKIGDRQCNKKVTNNGDGKWRCDRCEQTVDECDYRYILQLQIQDHTGLTWVTAFQESGEEIIGVSAKDLYYLKHEEQDDDKFNEIMHNAIFKKYMFKLKVKEETFSDEQRVKSTVVKADRVNFESETRFLFDSIERLKLEDLGVVPGKIENAIPSSGLNSTGFGMGIREPTTYVSTYNPSTSNFGRESGMQTNQGTSSFGRESGMQTNQGTSSFGRESGMLTIQGTSYGSQYGGSRFATTAQTGMYTKCNSCGGTGHSSMNCPQFSNNQSQSSGGGGGSFSNSVSSGAAAGTASSECFKCHQFGHWARDCPNVSNAPPAYGSGSMMSGRYGSAPRQHVGGF